MAAHDTVAKLHVYRAIYGLNLSFARIVEHCAALGESKILPPKYVRRYQSFAQELQAQINEELTGILDSVESDDLFRFGKVREAWEKELRDPDDVFIEAEERRRKLARQRRKRGSGRRTKNAGAQSRAKTAGRWGQKASFQGEGRVSPVSSKIANRKMPRSGPRNMSRTLAHCLSAAFACRCCPIG